MGINAAVRRGSRRRPAVSAYSRSKDSPQGVAAVRPRPSPDELGAGRGGRLQQRPAGRVEQVQVVWGRRAPAVLVAHSSYCTRDCPWGVLQL